MNILKIASLVLTWVFHPLFIITYVLTLMLIANPYAFGVPDWTSHHELILKIFLNTSVLPAVGVVLFRLVGFSSSLNMKDSKERVGPYIASGVIYLWMFTTIQHISELPPLLKAFLLGATISIFLAFFINNFSKVSAHTTGMGGFLGMWLVASTQGYGKVFFFLPGAEIMVNLNSEVVLMFVVLATGLVGSARLYLKAHEPQEIFGGYLIGFAGQLLAQQFINSFA